MEYDVFISYSRKDYKTEDKQIIPDNIISKIKELFTNSGISYWIDEEGIFSGDAFTEAIARNIKSSKIFLFISSENSNASQWTSNEIATANAYKKKIIPFRIDNSTYNDSVIMYIASLDYIDYTSNPEKAMQQLAMSVKNYIKREAEKLEKAQKEAETKRQNEIALRERAAKLELIHKQIHDLEAEKIEVEKEIFIKEKELIDYRGKKSRIENTIANYRAEEVLILGYTTKPSEEKAQPKRNIQKNPATSNTVKEDSTNFFAKEWNQIKATMKLRHWSVNTMYVLAMIMAIFTTALFIKFSIDSHFNHIYITGLALAAMAGCFGMYRTLTNKKDGLFLIAASIIVIALILSTSHLDVNGRTIRMNTYMSDKHHIAYRYKDIIRFASALFALLGSTLFIRKNGVSTWAAFKK